MNTRALLTFALLLLVLTGCRMAPREDGARGGIGSRVYVVERSSGSLAVFDMAERKLQERRITGLGDLQHATMTFSPDLRWGFLATRSGQVTRIDLGQATAAGSVKTSSNSIDNAISHDGRYLAVAEYIPGGVSIVDTGTLKVVGRHDAKITQGGKQTDSRVTGMVDAPGNRFVCVLIEGAEVWVIDATKPSFPIERKVKLEGELPYDAMITPDGRHYLVGHTASDLVSVVDLQRPDEKVRTISLRDPKLDFDRKAPVKLPHMASWAVARDRVFVPLVGEKRLAVLRRGDFSFEKSVPVEGHPVYAVRSPSESELWVSFSGEADDAKVQVIDTETLETKRTMVLGGRIYHLDFTPRGSHALVTANRDEKLFVVNTQTYEVEHVEKLASPSGIFGAWRAFKLGL